MEEPKLSFAELRKKFDPKGSSTTNNTNTTTTTTSAKATVQPTVEKNANPTQLPITTAAPKQNNIVNNSPFMNTKPAETIPINKPQTVIPQKVVVEPEKIVPVNKPQTVIPQKTVVEPEKNVKPSFPPEDSKPTATLTPTIATVKTTTITQPKATPEIAIQPKITTTEAEPPKTSIKDRLKMFEKGGNTNSEPGKVISKTPSAANAKPINFLDTEAHDKVKASAVPQTTSSAQAKTLFKPEPAATSTTTKEPEVEKKELNKPVVGGVFQNNMNNKEETKVQEAPKVVNGSNGIERKQSGEKPAPSIIGRNKAFSQNLNALLGGGRGHVEAPMTMTVNKPKAEENPAQDSYTEALLAKPTTQNAKKKSTLVFTGDDDDDF